MPDLKALLPRRLRLFLRNIRHLWSLDLHRLLWQITAMEKSIRGISGFALQNGPVAATLFPIPHPHAEINKHEFRIYSQNGEDGILLWLFSKIGTTSRTFIEFGMGTGRECISTNLILNFGWRGLLMDGSPENVSDAKLFFKLLMPWEECAQLDIHRQFITKDNINTILASRKHMAQPDLLAIDIDGNDYWVWEKVTVVDPRVVVIEYNSTYGWEEAISSVYKPSFNTYQEDGIGLYHGASLAAFVKLGAQKGYACIGCDSNGANTFFVKKELLGDISTVSPKQAFYENQHKLKRGSREVQFARIKDKPYARV